MVGISSPNRFPPPPNFPIECDFIWRDPSHRALSHSFFTYSHFWLRRAFARRRFLGLFPTWFDARHAAVSTILLTRWLVGPARLVDVPAADLDSDAARGPGWGNSPIGSAALSSGAAAAPALLAALLA